MNEHTRAEYFRALARQKQQLKNTEGFVNPSVDNDVDTLAQMDTEFSGVTNYVTPNLNEKIDINKPQKEQNIFQKVDGFLDEMGSKFITGISKGIEGIFDFGANALGAITGNENFTQWASQDISTAFGEWVKTASDLWELPHLVQGIAEGRFNQEYWQDLGNSLADIMKSATFQQNNLNYDFDQLSRDYHFNDYELQTPVGDFIGGLVESFGQMLPSVALGGLAGSQALGLTAFGLAAGGNATEQAINEGATAKQALLSGAISGGVEVLSEIVVGGLLNKTPLKNIFGEFGGNIAGIKIGSLASKSGVELGAKTLETAVKKHVGKEIVKSMIEEGTEEVFSDLFSPLSNMVYQGADAWKGESGKFIYMDPTYWKNVGVSFASGAVMGAVSSGGQNVMLYNKLGAKGYAAFNNINQVGELQNQYNELRQQGYTNEQALEELKITDKNVKEMQDLFDTMDSLEKENPVKFNNLMNLLTGGKDTYSNWEKQDQQNYVENIKYNIENTYEKNYIESRDRILSSENLANVETRIVDDETFRSADKLEAMLGTKLSESVRNQINNTQGSQSYILAGNQIIIPQSNSDRINQKYLHESISHAIIDSDYATRRQLKKDIQKAIPGLYEQVEKEVKQKYGDKVKKANSLESETIAYIVENFTDSNTFWKNMESTGLERILNTLKGYASLRLKRIKGDIQKSTYNDIMNITKAVNKAINKLRKQANAKTTTTNVKTGAKAIVFSVDKEDIRFSIDARNEEESKAIRNETAKRLIDEATNENFKKGYLTEIDNTKYQIITDGRIIVSSTSQHAFKGDLIGGNVRDTSEFKTALTRQTNRLLDISKETSSRVKDQFLKDIEQDIKEIYTQKSTSRRAGLQEQLNNFANEYNSQIGIVDLREEERLTDRVVMFNTKDLINGLTLSPFELGSQNTQAQPKARITLTSQYGLIVRNSRTNELVQIKPIESNIEIVDGKYLVDSKPIEHAILSFKNDTDMNLDVSIERNTFNKLANKIKDNYQETGEQTVEQAETVEKQPEITEKVVKKEEKAKKVEKNVENAINKEEKPAYNEEANTKYNINVAPYKHYNVSGENELKTVRERITNKYISTAHEIIHVFGFKDFTYDEVTGGYKFSDGKYKDAAVNETSYKFSSEETLDNTILFASLMADLGHETQEAVIVANYVPRGSENANGVEISIKLKNTGYANEIKDIAIRNGIESYTYDDTTGVFATNVIYEYDNEKETITKFDNFVDELKERGYVNEKQQYEYTQIESRYLQSKDRRNIYQTWLENSLRGQNGEQRNYVSKAIERTRIVEQVSEYEQQVREIADNELKNVDLDKVVLEKTVNNGQEKQTIKRDNNTESLFKIAELIEKIQKIEFNNVKEYFSTYAKKYHIEWKLGENAQTLLKSKTSIADKLYRNMVEGKYDPFIFKDYYRTTYIFNEENINDLEALLLDVSNYAGEKKYIDISKPDNEFGYKGVHLNLKYQDIPIEIQLHSTKSWDVKLKQDTIYDRWRSKKTKLTEEEKIQKEKDYAYSRSLSETLEQDSVYKQIKSLAQKINGEVSQETSNAKINTPSSVKNEIVKAANITSSNNSNKQTEQEVSNKKFEETNPLMPKNHETALVKNYAEWNRNMVTSLKTNEDVVNAMVKTLEVKYGGEVKITPPVSKANLSRKLFEEISLSKNATDFREQLDMVVDAIMQSKVRELDENGHVIPNQEYSLQELDQEGTLRTELVGVAEQLYQAKAQKSKLTKAIDYINKLKLDRISLREKVRERTARISVSRALNNTKKSFPKHLQFDLDWSGNNPEFNITALLAKPIMNLNANAYGYGSVGELKANIDELLTNYTEDNQTLKSSYLDYDENIRNMYMILRDSLDNNTDNNLTASQIRYANKILKVIKKLSNDAVQNAKRDLIPVSLDAKRAIIEEGKKPNLYARTVEARWQNIEEMLGDSNYAYRITVGLREGLSDARKYNGDHLKPLENYIKERKSLKKSLEKVSNFRNTFIQRDCLVDLYISLNTRGVVKNGILKQRLNYDLIDENGIEAYDVRTGKKVKLAEKGQAEALKTDLENFLTNEEKEYAVYLKSLFNENTSEGELQYDYKKWYVRKYDTDPNIVDDYYPISISSDYVQNKVSMYKSAPLFGNQVTRIKTREPYLVTSATMKYSNYVTNFSRECFVTDKYKQLFKIGNISTGSNNTTVFETLKTHYKNGNQVVDYVTNALNEIVGIKERERNKLISYAAGGYQLSLLSANVGTALRQPISMLFGTYSLGRIIKAGGSLVFNTTEYRDEFKYLTNEIGALKYRASGSSDLDIEFETNWFRKGVKGLRRIASKGMVLTKLADRLAMNVGLAASMNSAIENGYKIGTQEFRDYVKKMYYRYDLTQINSDPLGQNELSKNELLDLAFNKMQGPYRVMIGSIVDKIRTLKKFFNYNLEQQKAELAKIQTEITNTSVENLEQERENLFNEFEQKQQEYRERINNAVDENEKVDIKEERDKYKEKVKEEAQRIQNEIDNVNNKLDGLKAKEIQIKNEIADYDRFKKMGGVLGLPTSVASGILAMGIIGALIDALVSRLKGKDDWDEWDTADFLQDVAFTSTVSWLPIINTFSNSIFKDYNLSNPTGAILDDTLNSLKDIYNLLQGGFTQANVKKVITDTLLTFSQITGLPLKTIYNYMYGTIKTFDVEMALRFRNVFYNVTNESSIQSYKVYAEKGNTYKAGKVLQYNMENWRVSNTTPEINKILATFTADGYNVLPKAFPTTYIDSNGDTQKLTTSQIIEFRKLYNESTKQIKALLEVSSYKTATKEEQAKIIRKIYDTYYAYAKSKILNLNGTNRLTNLLLFTNNNVNIGKMLLAINKIDTITETRFKTKKELVIDYVNRLRGYSRQEKLLILKLAGYSSNEANKSLLSSYLTRLGMSKTNVQAFMG